eukprot:m.114988 g.114988  ORF g.114988 m.114988 type:complete len:59 (-) comp17133_c0_seq2:1415-1591(-)
MDSKRRCDAAHIASMSDKNGNSTPLHMRMGSEWFAKVGLLFALTLELCATYLFCCIGL